MAGSPKDSSEQHKPHAYFPALEDPTGADRVHIMLKFNTSIHLDKYHAFVDGLLKEAFGLYSKNIINQIHKMKHYRDPSNVYVDANPKYDDRFSVTRDDWRYIVDIKPEYLRAAQTHRFSKNNVITLRDLRRVSEGRNLINFVPQKRNEGDVASQMMFKLPHGCKVKYKPSTLRVIMDCSAEMTFLPITAFEMSQAQITMSSRLGSLKSNPHKTFGAVLAGKDSSLEAKILAILQTGIMFSGEEEALDHQDVPVLRINEYKGYDGVVPAVFRCSENKFKALLEKDGRLMNVCFEGLAIPDLSEPIKYSEAQKFLDIVGGPQYKSKLHMIRILFASLFEGVLLSSSDNVIPEPYCKSLNVFFSKRYISMEQYEMAFNGLFKALGSHTDVTNFLNLSPEVLRDILFFSHKHANDTVASHFSDVFKGIKTICAKALNKGVEPAEPEIEAYLNISPDYADSPVEFESLDAPSVGTEGGLRSGGASGSAACVSALSFATPDHRARGGAGAPAKPKYTEVEAATFDLG